MEQNKKKLLLGQIDKINEVISTLSANFSQKEVADLLGISQSYISRLEKKIIKKMKKDIMSKTG